MDSDLGNKKVMAKNIQYYLDKNGLTRKKLASDLNISYTTLSSWLQADSYPRIDKIEMMANYFKISKADLVENHDKKVPASNMEYLYNSDTVVMQIPLLGDITCGDPITPEENIEDYIPETYQKDNVPSGTLFALRAKGHSMEPTIPDGSTVIVRQQPSVEDGEIAAVLVDDETRATLKRVKHSNGVVMLQPDNRDYDPIVLTPTFPGKILGKAIKVEYPL